MTAPIFDDDALLNLLEKNDISYQRDARDGLITVFGNVDVPFDDYHDVYYRGIVLRKLKAINGSFNAFTSYSCCALPHLETVMGDVKLKTKASFIRWPNLKNVSGAIVVFSLGQKLTFSCPKLSDVGHDLMTDADRLFIPKLKQVNANLWATNAERFNAKRLEIVGKHLKLDMATSVNVPILKIVDGSLKAP